ncbi:MAG: RluA family pseudouridine synthase [Clostridia bacterium]
MDILFEDNHIIVVKKPQNVPSQEDASGDKDMLTMVKEYIKEKYNKPGNVFVGLVHRLDRPTGGVMVFAKTSKAASRLSEELASGDMEKIYFAVVVGAPKNDRGRLVHYLKKNSTTNTVETVPMMTEGAKKAELDYEVIEKVTGYSLVKIHLLTGRSHQARVQMLSMGTPIYGDSKYQKTGRITKDLHLFAVELKFNHPITKERMVFKCYPDESETSKWSLFNLPKHIEVGTR